MKAPRTLLFILFAAVATACATGHTGDKSVAEYCSDPKKANTDTCKVQAGVSANSTKISAVEAKADTAQKTADAAMARQDGVFCETRTVRYAKSGACSAGYTLVGCTQSRYWKRAGNVSIMREIDDQQCTYATKVLEIKVRCCMVGAQAAQKEEPLIEGGKAKTAPAVS
jgi:hypothetical protein